MPEEAMENARCGKIMELLALGEVVMRLAPRVLRAWRRGPDASTSAKASGHLKVQRRRTSVGCHSNCFWRRKKKSAHHEPSDTGDSFDSSETTSDTSPPSTRGHPGKGHHVISI